MDILKFRHSLADKEDIVNNIFLGVWAVIFGFQFLCTTMIDYSFFILPYRICLVIMLAILCYRFIIAEHLRSDLAPMLLLLAAGLGMLFFRHTKQYFIWAAVIAAAKNVRFDKIVRVSVAVGIFVMIIAFAGVQAGLVEDIVHNSRGGHVSHSLGIVYSTDCAAHVFYIILGIFYLKWRGMRMGEYAAIAVIAIAVFEVTRARNNTICTFLLMAAAIIYRLAEVYAQKKGKAERFHRLFVIACCAFMIFCIGFSLYHSFFFNADNLLISSLNEKLGGRYSMGYQAYCEYGLKLWGSDIPQFGGGGSSIWPDNYFFLDISYVSILLCQGIVIFMAALLLNVRTICVGRKKNVFLIVILALIALQSMLEHHMIELSYNYFLLAAFANIQQLPSEEIQT